MRSMWESYAEWRTAKAQMMAMKKTRDELRCVVRECKLHACTAIFSSMTEVCFIRCFLLQATLGLTLCVRSGVPAAAGSGWCL